jgi:hypothetical protein
MTSPRFRMSGLTYLDKLEIQEEMNKQLGGKQPTSDEGKLIEFEEEPTPPGTFGEPVTLTIIVGVIAIKALAIWLGKRTPPDVYEGEFEVEYPDGTRKKCKLRFTISKDKPVSDQVLEHLASVSGLPLAELGLQHGQ